MNGSVKVAALAVALVLVGGLSGCSGGAEPGGGVSTAATSVATEAAEPAGGADGTVSASGTVESARVRSLSFGTGGVVTQVKVKAGDKVAKGDLLAAVDATVPNEALDAAYTAYVAAQDGYAEAEKGEKKRAYAQLVKARNGYRAARRAVEGTRIHAPFAGTVTSVTATVDAEAQAGGAVVTLADLTRLRVGAEFTEADTALVKAGQKATVVFDSLDATVKGEVVSVAPTPVSAASTTGAGGGGGFQQSATSVVRYEVLVSLSSRPKGIRSGTPATVEITTG
ncbi:efflux RND transporter periplasmic adaptor subunit [Actinocorallia sp. API 0066]|uniref:efflux RND transporter periplasmic adaptor subunit n=1 Tax=Actinocorallia sp. API 0066 TaxID=2896846 RepID=UPI001E644FE1|nr:efflux RND transporter periplasmic adaptor subunit [Actinocorallia sp. API 0066]MCD0448775.1 efflux RND transporter periplasmic adaptor subunit [Actinocorallia sp. API 0066]